MLHSNITKNDIKVLGRVVSITSKNTVASAEQIWDDNFDAHDFDNCDHGEGLNQYDINRIFVQEFIKLRRIFEIGNNNHVLFNSPVDFLAGIDVKGTADLENGALITGDVTVANGNVELTGTGKAVIAPVGRFINLNITGSTCTRELEVAQDATVQGKITARDLEIRNKATFLTQIEANCITARQSIDTAQLTVGEGGADFNGPVTADSIAAETITIGDAGDCSNQNPSLLVNGPAKFECDVTIDGDIINDGQTLDNKYKITLTKNSANAEGSAHNPQYTLSQGGTPVGYIDISDWFIVGGEIITDDEDITWLQLTLNDANQTKVNINLSRLLSGESFNLTTILQNSDITGAQEGDILYYTNGGWTLANLNTLINNAISQALPSGQYWKIDNGAIVPNTTNTGGVVDVKTTGAIYSGH